MEILNIGPLELIIILILMFVVLGPKEMVLTAQRIGRWIRTFVRSPMWREIWGYSQEIRELPQKIMEESGLEETLAEVRQSTQAAADELQNQIKEVTDATRVPELEHLRIDPNAEVAENKLIPALAADTASASAQIEEQAVPVDPALLNTAFVSTEIPSSEPAAVLSTDLEPVSTNINSPVSDAAVLPVVEGITTPAEAAVVKKPRRRKTQEAEASAEVISAEGTSVEEAAKPKPRRRKSSAAVDVTSAVVGPDNALVVEAAMDLPAAKELPVELDLPPAEVNAPLEVKPSLEEIPQPKPRRRKKVAPEVQVTQSLIEENQPVETTDPSAGAAQPNEPIVAEVSVVEESEAAKQPDAVGQSEDGKQPEANDLITEGSVRDSAAAETLASGSENSEPTPVRRPRKPRAPRLKQPASETIVTNEPLNGGSNGAEHGESQSIAAEEEPQKSDAA